MKFSTRHWASAGMASIMALATAQYAAAQTTSADTSPAPSAPQGQEQGSNDSADIIVTGTNLRGVAPVGSAVIAVGQAAMQQTGLATTTDILKTVPQVSSLGPGEATIGSTVNNAALNTTRANGLNLRGLGV